MPRYGDHNAKNRELAENYGNPYYEQAVKAKNMPNEMNKTLDAMVRDCIQKKVVLISSTGIETVGKLLMYEGNIATVMMERDNSILRVDLSEKYDIKPYVQK